MDPRFSPHNLHLESASSFVERDPHLIRLQKHKFIYHSPIIDQLPNNIPGIYTLSGGRQVGKTTLLKQWMAHLLDSGITPRSIAFFSGELIDDHHSLLRIIQEQLMSASSDKISYLILDEVTYTKDWDKAIKYAADSGLLTNVILMLTGSDLLLIKEARMRLPGRRGGAAQVDFHLYPLTFAEVIKLKNISSNANTIFAEFNNYLKHGGYLTAINDLANFGTISMSTLNTYSDWIRGDVLKRSKQEQYLREILSAIIKRYGSQISWNSISRDLSIDHHKTISDYIELLVSMDVLFIQYALHEDKLGPAIKKARKVIFTDPFIFHAVRAWLWPNTDPFQNQICKAVNDMELTAQLVEACVVAHYRRFYPTYYIKAEGEVDIAYTNKDRFWPIEIKWTNQLHSKDLKQVIKYKNSRIWTKSLEVSTIFNIQTEPLVLALLQI